jgi:hypothetical protein
VRAPYPRAQILVPASASGHVASTDLFHAMVSASGDYKRGLLKAKEILAGVSDSVWTPEGEDVARRTPEGAVESNTMVP